jgi:hypothetical protein
MSKRRSACWRSPRRSRRGPRFIGLVAFSAPNRHPLRRKMLRLSAKKCGRRQGRWTLRSWPRAATGTPDASLEPKLPARRADGPPHPGVRRDTALVSARAHEEPVGSVGDARRVDHVALAKTARAEQPVSRGSVKRASSSLIPLPVRSTDNGTRRKARSGWSRLRAGFSDRAFFSLRRIAARAGHAGALASRARSSRGTSREIKRGSSNARRFRCTISHSAHIPSHDCPQLSPQARGFSNPTSPLPASAGTANPRSPGLEIYTHIGILADGSGPAASAAFLARYRDGRN